MKYFIVLVLAATAWAQAGPTLPNFREHPRNVTTAHVWRPYRALASTPKKQVVKKKERKRHRPLR